MDSFDFLFVALIMALYIDIIRGRCVSPQYVVVGKTETIICPDESEFHAIAWYTSEGFLNKESFLRLVNGAKRGDGYTSGEFDVHPNGSLVINNVTLHHDRNFTVLRFDSVGDDSPDPSQVAVKVVVKPPLAQPVVTRCKDKREICLVRLKQNDKVSCKVQGARPSVALTWVARTAQGDIIIPSETSVTKNGPVFTSKATTLNPFPFTSDLSYLVCKANGPPGILEEYETAIFVENSGIDYSILKPLTTFVRRGSKMEISCSHLTHVELIIWKKMQKNGNFSTISLASFHGEENSVTYLENYSLQRDGSLVIPHVEDSDEGLYGCAYENHYYNGSAALFDVKTYVPTIPFVDGCINVHSCLIEVHGDGSLTCSVTGIRPLVKLGLETFHEAEASLITFADREVITNNNEDTFDVYLTSKYHIDLQSLHSKRLLTIVCKVLEPRIKTLQLAFVFNLSIALEETIDEPHLATKSFTLWMIVIITSLVSVLLVVGIFIKLKGQRGGSQSKQGEGGEESTTLMTQISRHNENSPEKRNLFIKQLKTKYYGLYNVVLPIPYIRDRQYCVNGVFVDSGIEYLASNEGNYGQGTWSRLSSYHAILNEQQLSEGVNTFILEGDPGYGKSTLSLQLAYDWCNKSKESLLQKVDIFILLRLRQMEGDMSIVRAIKQFLLPLDSQLTEDDIKEILLSDLTTMIVLDGYDEYPDRHNDKSVVHRLLSRDIYQGFLIFLTTRSSNFPKHYATGAQRLRLKGFDEQSRDTYIRNVVARDDLDAMTTIREQFQNNPVLRDICYVPLFFVMFAHLVHDSKDTVQFTSITTFFRHTISCFHYHYQNKGMETIHLSNFATKHKGLDKIAFKGLSEETKRIVWKRDNLCKQVGKAVYNYYINIGILVEEEILHINNSPGTTDHLQQDTEVRFYHKLFCEWYAAHYVASKAGKYSFKNLARTLQNVDLFDLHYVYRFACGLNPVAASKIIKYANSKSGGDKFALLCILEQKGEIDSIKETVKSLCKTTVKLEKKDSNLIHRCMIQLLDIASGYEIPITSLYLENSCKKVELSTGHIHLTSDIRLPVLPTLKELQIEHRGRTFTGEEIAGFIKYSSDCRLEKLRFLECLLPQSVKFETTFFSSSDVFQVEWRGYVLNLKSGEWIRHDGEVITAEVYDRQKEIISCYHI